MNKRIFSNLCFSISVLFIISCSDNQRQANQLSNGEKDNGWKLLFDGESLKGWHLYRKGNIPSVWEVNNGELSCNPNNQKEDGDLVTDGEYENFDLTFEWKMAADGNSGVFINSIERDSIPAAWFSGPEYQLLGSANPDYATPNKRTGCLFGFSPQINPVAVKPADEWNRSRIKQVNGKVEFYLNDTLTTSEDFKSQAWFDAIKQSGFSQYPEYGRYTKGHIVLQDWAKGVSFRNIKIKEL